MSDIAKMNLKDLAAAIKRRKVSSVEVTKALLARIARAVTPMLTRFAAGAIAMPLETEPSTFVAVQHKDAGR